MTKLDAENGVLTRVRTIYIAGPMTGLDNFNFGSFFDAEYQLREEGWRAVNPAQHDLTTGSVYLEDGRYKASPDFDLEKTLFWDLGRVAECDAIYMLDGWENSKGAAVEIALAQALGKEVLYQTEPLADWERELLEQPVVEVMHDEAVSVNHGASVKDAVQRLGEVRTTSATGGMKGKKPEQLSALDPLALKRVAEVAGFGANKYDRLNFMKGFDWSLAYDALFRHTLDALNGDDYDEESGLLNLAHAVWQGLALISFHERGLGTDDRYTTSALADLQTKQVS